MVSGYGVISTTSEGKQKHLLTHRLAYEDAKGPIPAGLVVRHTCDNPPCVNPRHLLVGTRADNNRDRDERKRNRNRYSGVTRCIRGHAFDEENTYTHFTPDGAMRQCRECRRMRRAQARAEGRPVV
jgi:hypothetical protein